MCVILIAPAAKNYLFRKFFIKTTAPVVLYSEQRVRVRAFCFCEFLCCKILYYVGSGECSREGRRPIRAGLRRRVGAAPASGRAGGRLRPEVHGRLRVVGREQGSGLVRAHVAHASPHAPSGRPGGRVEKKSGSARSSQG